MEPESIFYYYHETETPDVLPGSRLDDLLGRGWFRMRQTIFTTSHIIDWDQITLRKVWWLRYTLADIRSHASHRNIYKLNQRFRVSYQPLQSPDAQDEELFSQYRASLAFDTYDSLHQALYDDDISTLYNSQAIRVYDGDRMIAIGIYDTGTAAAASIVHGYEPEYKNYSLGKYLMLLTIDRLRSQGFQHYYPGYVVAGNPRFDYKLFLGKEAAAYYEPIAALWLPFHEKILVPNTYSEEDLMQFISL